jgi:hypothetical protein
VSQAFWLGEDLIVTVAGLSRTDVELLLLRARCVLGFTVASLAGATSAWLELGRFFDLALARDVPRIEASAISTSTGDGVAMMPVEGG